MQQSVHIVLPRTSVYLVNPELFVSLVTHRGYKFMFLLSELDRQPCMAGKTSVEPTLSQYFLASVVQGPLAMFVSFLQGISVLSPPCSKEHEKKQASDSICFIHEILQLPFLSFNKMGWILPSFSDMEHNLFSNSAS